MSASTICSTGSPPSRPEALGEEAPDELEDEVADLADLIGRGPPRAALVEATHDGCGVGRQLAAVREEERLLVREEVERLVTIWQLGEVEAVKRRRREPTRFPDLEALERGQDDEARRGETGYRIVGVMPVLKRLGAVFGETIGLAGPFHFNDRDAGVEAVDDTA